MIVGLAAAPAVWLWSVLLDDPAPGRAWKVLAVAVTILPAILLFGLILLMLSAATTRLMHWRTPDGAVLVLARLEWPLLRWVCYVACTHVANLLVGSWLRASPPWSWYLRANGARVGRRVYVNTLKLTDHNLLDLEDGAVIGSDVHVSGHTVERGCVLTGRVRVGKGAVIGVGSVVGIDVDIGDRAQVGAMSFVPKHSRLEAGRVYAGVPVHPREPP